MVLPENKGKGLGSITTIGTLLGFTPWPYQMQIKTGKMRLSENASFDVLIG